MEKKSRKSTAKPKRKRVSRPKSQGLGDTIEKVTEATGIKKAVEVVSEALGVDCGCEQRKNWLNERFRYKDVECMTKDQAEKWKDIDVDPMRLSHKQRKEVSEFHAEVFKKKPEMPCTCAPSEWARLVNEIEELYQAYLSDHTNE
jgi:hypothetical protein